jgi:hypothetical protein
MDQLHERFVETKDLTNDLFEMYGALRKERKGLGPWTSKSKKAEVNGFEISTDRCNMDPTSFIQPTLYGVSRLTEHFQLSHLEIHSSQIAGTYVPNVKYFIAIAAELLIVMNPPRMSQHGGLSFGRLLLLVAHSVRGSQPQTKQERRFATQQFPKVPSRADWAKIA